MDFEEGTRGAWGRGTRGQELLNEADFLLRVEVAGGDVVGGEGEANFWAGGGLRGGRGHWEELIATLLLDRVLLSS